MASDPAEGYRFGERAWDPELWGSGETMSVVLLDSPEWELDIMEMKRILQRTLDLWANIPTADIRWQIDRIVTAEEFEALKHRYGEMTVEPSRGRDHATMTFTDDHLVDCKVRPMPYPQAHNIFSVAVHEFGHCLGLMHPDPFVFRPYYLHDESLPSYWRHDPIMAHGVYPWGEDLLSVDDAIGASLLRPREGWLPTTGSIVGRVALPDGEGVRFASVLATRLRETEDLSYSVGVFTDNSGYFEIRGLDPGDYQLLVRSPVLRGNLQIANIRRTLPAVILDLRQALRTDPVRVRAGEASAPVALAVRRRSERFR